MGLESTKRWGTCFHVVYDLIRLKPTTVNLIRIWYDHTTSNQISHVTKNRVRIQIDIFIPENFGFQCIHGVLASVLFSTDCYSVPVYGKYNPVSHSAAAPGVYWLLTLYVSASIVIWMALILLDSYILSVPRQSTPPVSIPLTIRPSIQRKQEHVFTCLSLPIEAHDSHLKIY